MQVIIDPYRGGNDVGSNISSKYEKNLLLDLSKYMALIINTLNKKEDIEELYNGKKKIINKINKKKELEEKQIKLDI